MEGLEIENEKDGSEIEKVGSKPAARDAGLREVAKLGTVFCGFSSPLWRRDAGLRGEMQPAPAF